MDDLISRQKAIATFLEFIVEYLGGAFDEGLQLLLKEKLEQLPAAQPKPAIPISWLKKEIERLESRKNSFAVLDAAYLKTLIKRWRGEQNENT